MKKELKIDQNEIKKYFEFENTLSSMFTIWEKYFGVKITFIRKLTEIHNDIMVYKCTDTKSSEDLGTIILDLFPREGKYGHACVDSTSPRYFDDFGNLHSTTGVLICNFTKNKSGKSFISIENVSISNKKIQTEIATMSISSQENNDWFDLKMIIKCGNFEINFSLS